MAVAHSSLRMPRQRVVARQTDSGATFRSRSDFRTSGRALLGGGLLILLILFVLVGPHLWTTPAQTQDLTNRLASPAFMGGSSAHPLGADQLGRDTLALLIAGARTSLWVATISSLLAATMGTLLGLCSGFWGGPVRGLVDWAIDVQLALPFVVVAIALTATFGNSFLALVITLVVTGWLVYARVVQTQVRALRQTEWVLAAYAAGASPMRIMARHLAPSILGTVGVLLTQQAGAMIFYEASLSFLGLGLGGNTMTLGGLVAQGRDAIFVAPWLAAFPGIVVAWAIFGFNLLGDGLSTRGRSRRP